MGALRWNQPSRPGRSALELLAGVGKAKAEKQETTCRREADGGWWCFDSSNGQTRPSWWTFEMEQGKAGAGGGLVVRGHGGRGGPHPAGESWPFPGRPSDEYIAKHGGTRRND